METIKNILYTGPVGVGKTYEAKKKAFEIVTGSNEDFSEAKFSELLNKEDSEIQLISLHSSYSYNDFVAGIQVETDGGNISYRNVNKIFANLCNKAKKSHDEKFVLILDDINRVNISEVLGESLFAIENRNESVRTSATLEDGKFSVPDNLYVIGTMSTNSTGENPDYAVLRRFKTVYLNIESIELESFKLGSALEEIVDEFYSKEWLQKYLEIKKKDDVDNNISKYIEECEKECKEIMSNENYKKLKPDIQAKIKEGKEILDDINVTGQKIDYKLERIKVDGKGKLKELKGSVNEWVGDLYAILESRNNINEICTEQANEIEGMKNNIIKKYKYYYKIVDDFASPELKHNHFIGYTYFLPNKGCPLENIEIVVKHKIRNQVLPLLKQYEKEGIIRKGRKPDDATTNTIYTTKYEEVNEEKLTICPRKNDLSNEEENKLSAKYKNIFKIVKKIINQNQINQFDIFDLLYNDYDITWNQETIKENGETIYGKIKGSLIVLKDDAEKLKTDEGKTHLYSNEGNIIKYRGKEYLLQSKYDNHFWNISLLGEKKKKGRLSSGNYFAIIINLVYEYILRYESNLKGICKEKNSSQEFQDKLMWITEDLEKIRAWNVKSGDKNKLPEDIYEKINNLNIWNEDKFKKDKGVYKRMDNNYKDVMDMTGVKQMILQGPPGTSKTYGAKEFLCEVARIDKKDGNSTKLSNYQLVDSDDNLGYKLPEESENKKMFWDIVQFHPSYGYEDFVRGISVSTAPNGGISYKTVNRTLAKMAAIAQVNTDKEFYLIIDEINRANIATVFGELIYALEYRGSAVATPYEIDSKNKLIIPSKMYIIGTMNTADKSIGNIDYAIRRRFLFFPLLPNFKVIKDSIEKNITAEEDYIELKLFYAIEKIFECYLNTEDYNKDDVQVGHTYFIRKSKEARKEQMKGRFIYQVIPVLREYYKDNVLSYPDITIDDNKKNEIYKGINDRSKVEDIIKFIMEKMVKDSSGDLKELYDTTDEEKKNLISMLNDHKYGEIVEVSYGIVSNPDEKKEDSNDGVGSN